jgi:hypothetical protein
MALFDLEDPIEWMKYILKRIITHYMAIGINPIKLKTYRGYEKYDDCTYVLLIKMRINDYFKYKQIWESDILYCWRTINSQLYDPIED